MALRNQHSLQHSAGTINNRKADAKYGSVDHSADVMARRRQLLEHHRAKKNARRGEVSQASQEASPPDATGDQTGVSVSHVLPSTT